MRTGRPKAALHITTEERERLESLAHRSRTAPALARRARILLACEEHDSKTVALQLRCVGADVKERQLCRFDRQRTPSAGTPTPLPSSTKLSKSNPITR